MLVLIANHLPNKVRGILKVWCLEPKPNVFVTDVSRTVEDYIIKFLKPYMSIKSGLIIIRNNGNNIQGFDLYSIGDPKRKPMQKTGLILINEKS